MWFDKAACDKKAGRLGKNYEWGPISGCMIEASPNVWIPLENYRIID